MISNSQTSKSIKNPQCHSFNQIRWFEKKNSFNQIRWFEMLAISSFTNTFVQSASRRRSVVGNITAEFTGVSADVS